MKTGLIIEDEQLTADRLESLIQKHTDVNVLAKLHSKKSAINWLNENPLPDLLFLDIQLGDGTGFDVLDSLDGYPHVIFTTAYDQYLMDAFKHNSLDYLLKPIKPEVLELAIEKLDRIHANEQSHSIDQMGADVFKKFKKKFLVKVGLKYRSITIEEVAYFHSEDSCTYLYSGDQVLLIDQTLDQLESLLDPELFFRINRHMMVKSDHIQSIDSYFNSRLSLELQPAFNEDVIVSREKVKAFKQWLDA